MTPDLLESRKRYYWWQPVLFERLHKVFRYRISNYCQLWLNRHGSRLAQPLAQGGSVTVTASSNELQSSNPERSGTLTVSTGLKTVSVAITQDAGNTIYVTVPAELYATISYNYSTMVLHGYCELSSSYFTGDCTIQLVALFQSDANGGAPTIKTVSLTGLASTRSVASPYTVRVESASVEYFDTKTIYFRNYVSKQFLNNTLSRPIKFTS